MINGYFKDRAQRVTAIRPPRSRLSQLRLGSELLQSSRSDADALDVVRENLNAMHGGYLRSETAVGLSELTVDGARALLRVTEHTGLYFADGSADVDHTVYRAEHSLEAHRSTRGWSLTRSSYISAGPASTPVTQFATGAITFADLTAEIRNSPARVADLKVAQREAAPNSGYDYGAMVAYARAWAFGRNPAYPTDYGDPPNQDCTNFVSQVMRAGGWQTIGSFPPNARSDNTKWFYGFSKFVTSYTWGAGENLHQFGLNSGRTYVMGNPWDMGSGDILFYDQDRDWEIDHSQVCTGRNSSGPLMTQHSPDYRDKPLGEIAVFPTSRTYAHRT